MHIAVTFSQRLFIRYLVEVYRARNDVMDYSGHFPLHLLSPELAPEFEMSILIPKPHSTSRNSTTSTIHRLTGKVTTKHHHQDVAQHSATHLLLSSLPFANGSCQPTQNVIHRLRQGLPLQLSAPATATGDENLRPSTTAAIASHKSKAATLRARPRRLSHTSSLRSLTNGWSTMRHSQLQPPVPPQQQQPPQGSRTLTFPRTSSMETPTLDARRHTLLLAPSSSHSALYKKTTLPDMATSAMAVADSSNGKFAVPRKASVFRRRRTKKGSTVTAGSGAALDSLLPPVPKSTDRRAHSICLLSRHSSVSTSSDLAKSPSSDSSFSGFGSSVEPPDLLTGCLAAVANRPQLSLYPTLTYGSSKLGSSQRPHPGQQSRLAGLTKRGSPVLYVPPHPKLEGLRAPDDIATVETQCCQLQNVSQATTLKVLGRAHRQHQDWFDDNDAEISKLLVEKIRLHKACMNLWTDATNAAFFICHHLVQQRLREMQDA
ncbi:unnamed protein product [Schistocephalus solidus]|uniref:Uncharacterized protein n=1 Tax=Schistocephalus solidus TaxID=70667 RepID=A0A3P7DIM1_SCHSO|nr:unnamed protein product [Schistocephalus solidus]